MSCWSELSIEEIRQMHGYNDQDDDHDDDTDLCHDEDDIDLSHDGCHCGNVCMDCLGMSWRDFY